MEMKCKRKVTVKSDPLTAEALVLPVMGPETLRWVVGFGFDLAIRKT